MSDPHSYDPDRSALSARQLQRADAETIPCPTCHVGIGHTCQNIHTGQELLHMPAHWARMQKAKG